ncbi:MAG: hypothetical protein HETSPECPRED_002940 [Heterodermia speciosa]|uniref:Methyltransferase type 11 domain-containing protein n=1 Tax=Heterodermia speciosa TaxID=116794 RepID=A0A8H3IDA1_9LECA|nr:MAG: hypothetical protein HETSPECPRED_002940 [Heterodermia speciosa]
MVSTSAPTLQEIIIRPYTPRHNSFPYGAKDFERPDEAPDKVFYTSPRFVTHIDDNAILSLSDYYSRNLPPSGRILDFCSSWISHFPKELSERAVASNRSVAVSASDEEKSVSGNHDEKMLEVIGIGLNAEELSANPILKSSIVQDLNTKPQIPSSVSSLDASTCVVSIEYLTKPVEVLTSVLERTKVGGKIHLVVSNRMFAQKAIHRWSRIGEEEKLQMVGDFLWWAGWRDVEICTLTDGKAENGVFSGILGGFRDPLWVVRGTKPAQ